MIPDTIKIRKKAVRKKYDVLSKTAKLDDEELLVLKKIVDDNPNYYLDEIVLMLVVQTGKALHYSTTHRYITHQFNYTLQSITACAKQQCEQDQNAFITSLRMLLQGDPDRLVMIDETHKDRNASRRRRGWSTLAILVMSG